MSNISILPIDRTLLGATTPGQSEPGGNGNKRVLCILQSSSITGTSSDCFMSYTGHSLGKESYPSAEMQSVHSTTQAEWANTEFSFSIKVIFCSYSINFGQLGHKKRCTRQVFKSFFIVC